MPLNKETKPKRFRADKEKKQKAPRKNNYRRRLGRWQRFWQTHPPNPKHYCIVLERAVAGIDLHINADKTEYMCFNQTGDISTQNGKLSKSSWQVHLPRKQCLINRDRHRHTTKTWTAINRLSVIGKSDLTDRRKRSFFQAAIVSILIYGYSAWMLTKRLEKKLDGNYTRMVRAILNKSWK